MSDIAGIDDPWAEWAPRPADIRARWEMRCRVERPAYQRAELAARSDIPADLRRELLRDPDTVDAGRRMIANGRGAVFDDPSVFATDTDDLPPAA